MFLEFPYKSQNCNFKSYTMPKYQHFLTDIFEIGVAVVCSEIMQYKKK